MSYPAPTIAEFLKSRALFVAAEATGVAWGDKAVETEIISALYDEVDAAIEAEAQLAFLSGPLVEDVVTVDGSRRDLMLRPIELEGDTVGPAFVIGFQEQGGTTDLIVIRSLA